MKKLFLIFVLTIGLWLIEACACICDSEKIPYFDYSSIFTSTFINYGENKLRIAFYPDDLTYLAEREKQPTSSFHLCTAAYAYECDCPNPGSLGAKYTLDSIGIKADRDFADGFPAGASLNTYFKLTTTYFTSFPDNSNEPLDSTTIFNLNELPELKYYVFRNNYPLHLFLVTASLTTVAQDIWPALRDRTV